jgi:hypothetical protein
MAQAALMAVHSSNRGFMHVANVPEFETALSQYHEPAVYGLFLWAVTRRVAP